MPRQSSKQPARNPAGLGANQSAQPSEAAGNNRQSRQRSSSESTAHPEDVPPPSRRRSHSAPGGVLRDIYHLQRSTGLLIPKLPFARLIRECLQQFSGSTRQLRITAECLMALQEAAELFLVQLFEDSIRCSQHRDRVTLMPKDMQLVLYLRRPR